MQRPLAQGAALENLLDSCLCLRPRGATLLGYGPQLFHFIIFLAREHRGRWH